MLEIVSIFSMVNESIRLPMSFSLEKAHEPEGKVVEWSTTSLTP